MDGSSPNFRICVPQMDFTKFLFGFGRYFLTGTIAMLLKTFFTLYFVDVQQVFHRCCAAVFYTQTVSGGVSAPVFTPVFCTQAVSGEDM